MSLLRELPLSELSEFALPTIVSLRKYDDAANEQETETPLWSWTGRHAALELSLDLLEATIEAKQQKSDIWWQFHNDSMTCPLTTLLTQDEKLKNADQALDSIKAIKNLVGDIPRRICGHTFEENDKVWRCQTCQVTINSVLCDSCYRASSHEGHDVELYLASGYTGAFCDCGDPEMFDPVGFCSEHGADCGDACAAGAVAAMPQGLGMAVQQRIRGIVPALMDWLVDNFAHVEDQTRQRMPESRSYDSDEPDNEHPKPDEEDYAKELGELGFKGHGLYLLLQHSNRMVTTALESFVAAFPDYTLMKRLYDVLQKLGQLVVWGTTTTILAECGSDPVERWTRVANLLLEKTKLLSLYGINFRIVTREGLQREQRAVAVLQWLTTVASSTNALCQTVAECILPDRQWLPLLRTWLKNGALVSEAWNFFLSTLLKSPAFRSLFAAAYCDTYLDATQMYTCSGATLTNRWYFDLSGRFLHSQALVTDLVHKQDLLGKLGKSLLQTCREDFKRVDPPHSLPARVNPLHFLDCRRYVPCIRNLELVLKTVGVKRLQGGTFLNDWIAVLTLTQRMNRSVWVQDSQRRYCCVPEGFDNQLQYRKSVNAFGLSFCFGDLNALLLSWCSDTLPLGKDSDHSKAQNPMKCVELCYQLLATDFTNWYHEVMKYYKLDSPESTAELAGPAGIKISSSRAAAARHGPALSMWALPDLITSPFSLHLPLHRFVATALEKLCMQPEDKVDGIANLLFRLRSQLAEEECSELFRFLLQFPALVLSRVAQARATKSDDVVGLQVDKYSLAPCCHLFRDLDLLLVQFAVIGGVLHSSPEARRDSDVGVAFLVHLLLYHVGLLGMVRDCADEFLDPTRTRNGRTLDIDTLRSIHPAFPGDLDVELLKLLEQFLHLIILISSELPLIPPTDKMEQAQQAKWRLGREVIGYLESGPKTNRELSSVEWHYLTDEGEHLESVVNEVAERKILSGTPGEVVWELRQEAWTSDDASFFRADDLCLADAAMGCPLLPPRASCPYAPVHHLAHASFQRLRRDITSDATVIAVIYRVVHLHCHKRERRSLPSPLRQQSYETEIRSGTALARCIHLLTLGVHAWTNSTGNGGNWREHGGGSPGSIFLDRCDSGPAPTVSDWIVAVFVADACALMGSDWYKGEENLLALLQRLARGNSAYGLFFQDSDLRSGANWLLQFAINHSIVAASISETLQPVADTTRVEGADPVVHDTTFTCNPIELANMAAFYEQVGDFQQMAEVSEACIAADPSFVDGYVGLATARKNLGDESACCDAIEHGLNVSPDNASLVRMRKENQNVVDVAEGMLPLAMAALSSFLTTMIEEIPNLDNCSVDERQAGAHLEKMKDAVSKMEELLQGQQPTNEARTHMVELSSESIPENPSDHSGKMKDAVSKMEELQQGQQPEDKRQAGALNVEDVKAIAEKINLRKETKLFLKSLRFYFECKNQMDDLALEVDPTEALGKIELPSASSGGGPYQQQNVDGGPLGMAGEPLDDLFLAAERSRSVFLDLVARIQKVLGAYRVEYSNVDLDGKKIFEEDIRALVTIIQGDWSGMGCAAVIVPPMKDRQRAREKAKDDYVDRNPGPPESWLHDVHRFSIICSSGKQVEDVITWLRCNANILVAKNRFKRPTFNGYRHMLLVILVSAADGAFNHLCEVQVHLGTMWVLNVSLDSHEHYEYFRSYFAGAEATVKESLKDLERVDKFGRLDESFIAELLSSRDASRLQRLAELLSTKLSEHDLAVQLLERALLFCDPFHYDSGPIHSSLAAAFIGQGYLEKGMDANKRCLKATESVLLGRLAIRVDNSSKAILALREAMGWSNAAVRLCAQHNYDGALLLLRSSLQRLSSTDSALVPFSLSPMVASILASIGTVLQQNGQSREALDHCERSLAMTDESRDRSVAVADTYKTMSACQRDMGDYDASLLSLRRAIQMYETVVGKSHDSTRSCYCDLAVLLQNRGEPEKALAQMEVVRMSLEEQFGNGHQPRDSWLQSVGSILFQRGDYNGALPYFREVQKMQELRAEGHDNGALVQSFQSIGSVLLAKADYDGAEEQFRAAAKQSEKFFGDSHPDTAIMNRMLGIVRWKKGDSVGARVQLQRALDIQEQYPDKSYLDLCRTHNIIGRILQEEGDYASALEHHDIALKGRLSKLGLMHAETASSLHNIGMVKEAQGEYDSALRLERKALVIREQVLNAGHPDIAWSCSGIGAVLSRMGEYSGALEMHQRALAICLLVFGENHPDTVASRIDVGRAQESQESQEAVIRPASSLYEITDRSERRTLC